MAVPIVREDLYHLIIKAGIEDALYLTGIMIIEGRITELENSWINACCGNELKDHLPSSWKWRHVIDETYRLVNDDAFDVTDAFLLTAKLCIFYKEVLIVENGENSIQGKKPSIHIRQLRNIIMEDFPEDAVLSQAGVKKYTKILPTNQEELMFSHRILSGLSRIWTEKQYHKSRDALEYLSRRKLRLELPNKSWPSPSQEEANQFTWFLWGAVLCYFQNAHIVNKMLYLFEANQKKRRKHNRYGLLWHVHYIAGNLEGACWTIDENKWIGYVKENAIHIWEQIQITQKEIKETERALKKASGHASPVEEFDSIFDYVPRIGNAHIVPEDIPYKPSHAYTSGYSANDTCTEKKIKIVGLKSGKDPTNPISLVRKIE